MNFHKHTYALYRGDTLEGIGTIDELAALRGIKRETIEFYQTPAYRKRTKAKATRLVKLEEDERA